MWSYCTDFPHSYVLTRFIWIMNTFAAGEFLLFGKDVSCTGDRHGMCFSLEFGSTNTC